MRNSDFENGAVTVNPTDNGSIAIQIFGTAVKMLSYEIGSRRLRYD